MGYLFIGKALSISFLQFLCLSGFYEQELTMILPRSLQVVRSKKLLFNLKGLKD